MARTDQTKNRLLSLHGLDAEDYLGLCPVAEPEPRKLRRPESRGLIGAATRSAELFLGRAAVSELQERMRRALLWAEDHYDAERGSFLPLGRVLVERAQRDFYQAHPYDTLRREREDQERRDRAAESEADLLEFLEFADVKLKGLQAVGGFCYVPGLGRVTPEAKAEFRAGMLVELLRVIREDRFRRYEKTGAEATYVFFTRYRTWLKKRRRVYEVFPPEDQKVILTPEELVLRHEEAQLARNLLPRAETLLTRKQRAWLAAMLADIKWHGELKLSRVAEQMGRDPAQTTRALASIRRAFRGRVSVGGHG